MITTEGGRISPIDILIIIGKLSLNESDESSESQRNKDVSTVRRSVRLVKYVLPFTLIRNTVAIETQHEMLQCVAICWHSSLKTVSHRIRLRLTIMCDSNKMYWIAEILTHSQIGLL